MTNKSIYPITRHWPNLPMILGISMVAMAIAYSPVIVMIGILIVAMAVVSLTRPGLIIAFSLILPVTVLTNFIDFKLSDIPFLENVRSAYLVFFVMVYAFHGLLDSALFRIYRRSLYFGGLLLILLLTVPFSMEPFKSLSFYAKTWLMIAVVFFAGINLLRDTANRRIFEWITTALVLVVVLFSMYQLITQSIGPGESLRNPNSISELTWFEYIKAPSFFATSYVASEFYFLFLPFLLFIAYSSAGGRKYLYFVGVAVILLGIFSSQQRSGLLIAAIEMTLMHMLVNGAASFSRMLKSLAVLCVVFMLMTLLLLSTEIGDALASRFVGIFSGDLTQINDMGSTLARLERILIAWSIFVDHPIAGAGLGLSPLIYPSYGWAWVDFDGGAHNLYLALLSETGVVGLMAFVLFLIKYFQMASSAMSNSHDSIQKKFGACAIVFGVAIVMDGVFSGLLGFPSILFVIIGFAYIYAECLIVGWSVPVNHDSAVNVSSGVN